MAPHANEPMLHDDSLQGVSANSPLFTVNSPNVTYTNDEIRSKYKYRTTAVSRGASGQYVATPKEVLYDFKVDRRVGRVGMMLVGWGGLLLQTSNRSCRITNVTKEIMVRPLPPESLQTVAASLGRLAKVKEQPTIMVLL